MQEYAASMKGVLRRRWIAGILLTLSYLAAMWLSTWYLAHPGILFPASAIALAVLFLEGLELWPAVYLAALIGNLFAGTPVLFLFTAPIAQTLQALLGAYLLRKAKLDPLFRRSRDIFFLTVVVILVSLIVPSIGSLTALIGDRIGMPYAISAWHLRYVGSIFCLLVGTPFLLRWIAKPRFHRTSREMLEVVAVFALLIGLDFAAFIGGIGNLGGIPTVYFLLVPLFWIALRLRPRFVTLGMLTTSTIAIASLYTGANVPLPSAFDLQLFQTEEFLIVITMIFSIIVSLEEDRRLSSNLLRSQVATLENAIARISSESKAKNDFISILGHELRNPLAPVVTAIDLLKARAGLEQEEAEMLAMMEDRMHTVRRLLDDLLNISRITEGKISIRKEPMDLEAVVQRAILSTEHHLKERHQSLAFKPLKEPVVIYGDSIRIEQIFSNLLTNASKYSDTGSHIKLTMKQQGDIVDIVVSDEGIGMDAAVLEEIFIPFYQADLGGRGKKGLGIGLALVRSFVELHDGTVTAASAGQGRGSQFTVRLPIIAGAAAVADFPTTEADMAPASIAPPKKGGGPHVLVVDDNDAAAWSMGRLLELKGCSVDYAYDGRQAIDKVASLNPDVVILDIGLPDQDGYLVARTMRARGYRGRLIALTGYSTEDARSKGVEVGFDHYLIKPAGFADLRRVIPELS